MLKAYRQGSPHKSSDVVCKNVMITSDGDTIELDSPYWWIRVASPGKRAGFYYRNPIQNFTATHYKGKYWYASVQRNNRLHRVYIGKGDKLNATALKLAAHKLRQKIADYRLALVH